MFLNIFFLVVPLFSHQYLAATLDAKINLKINKSDNWWHPRNYLTADSEGHSTNWI